MNASKIKVGYRFKGKLGDVWTVTKIAANQTVFAARNGVEIRFKKSEIEAYEPA